MRMAMNDMELVLIYLVRRYIFFPTKHVPQPIIAVTLCSANGNVLRFEKRK